MHLVELSPRLRDIQRQTLDGIAATWHDDIAGLPPGPALILANEFLDALPIRQFQRTEQGWHERMVGFDGAGLALQLAPQPVPEAVIPADQRAAPQGSIIELSPAREQVMHALARRIVAEGGALLIIDYGHASRGTGDTLQAVRAHRPAPLLDRPGEADLTAHVDFQTLVETAKAAGAVAYGPDCQGDWLNSLGIQQRASALKASASPTDAAAIDAAVARLTGSAQMGTLFKVMAVSASGHPTPAGFEDLA